MGNIVTTRSKVLVLGLSNSGKTTILYKFFNGEIETDVVQVGLIIEKAKYKQFDIMSWDLAPGFLRPFYRYFLKDCKALIYVVDSNDVDTMERTQYELTMLLEEKDMRDVPILVFSNKQDLPQGFSPTNLPLQLGLHRDIYKKRKWFIQPCTASKGEGIQEGFDWLEKTLASK